MPSSPPTRRPRSGFRRRGALVLVAQGDALLREIHAAALASAGFMVLAASDGAAAIDSAVQYRPHGLVLDLALPGVEALEVARRLRSEERTSNVGIIALAGLASEHYERLAYAAGCDTLMTTPVLPAALVGELVRLIAKKTRDESQPDMSRVGRT